MAKQPIDFAVVGGGVGGVYSAWRLKQAYPHKHVVLFEYSDRIGGRLLSPKFPGVHGIRAELGGMRYLPSQHKLVNGLVQELDLATREFPMGGDNDPDGLNNYAYFRGKHLRIREMGDSAKVPFHLNWAEQNLTPDSLQTQLMKLLVPNWHELRFDDWFNVKVFGAYLWEYGFWNLLYRVLSPDAYAFLKYGSGYDTNVSNGNAVVLLPTGGDYSSANHYRTIVDGMEALPVKLAEQFEGSYRGEIRTNQRLKSIRRRGDRLYDLDFHRTETTDGKTRDAGAPAEPEVAAHVILAMPRRSLELIEWDCFTTDPWLRENLGSVLRQSAFKIFLAYDYPWWEQLGLQAGRSISDLPLRQTFYFGSPATSDRGDHARSRALLMASYNDIETIPFWKGLERGDLFRPAQSPAGLAAPEQMVAEVHRQVQEMHGQRELPQPVAAAYRDWGEEPYGAGWHCWKPGFRFNDVMAKMRHPVADEQVYICGEAYSSDQGWAEGALETAELMLSRDLEVPAHRITQTWQPNFLKRLNY